MRRLRGALVALVLLLAAAPAVVRPQAPQPVRELAPGVTYRHLQQTAPDGQPWSVHVLEVHRDARGVALRAVAGIGADGSMQRERPTAMAARVGAAVLGVVNGDYDLGAPYLGIPDGLSITSGELWTTGRADRPALAVTRTGRPVIAVPRLRIELRAGRRRIAVAAVNKPFGAAWGRGPRLFTRAFGAQLRSRAPLRVVVVGGLRPALPLRVGETVRGTVERVVTAGEFAIPADKLLLAEPASASALAGLRTGQQVRINMRVEVGGRRDIAHAVGGFPILVRNGQRDILGSPGAYLRLRHPRTAVCYSKRSVILTVVDGRQPALSAGMTLEELADLMVRLGCTVAMNTDGGGSSVMAVAGGNAPAPPGDAPENGSVVGEKTVFRGRGARAHRFTAGRGFFEVDSPPVVRRVDLKSEISNLKIVNSPSDGRERGRGNAWVVVRR